MVADDLFLVKNPVLYKHTREAGMLDLKLREVGLSNREVEVTKIIAKGVTNREASDMLFVTEKTVKFHLTNIYKKMRVKSRSQLIIWCAPHLQFVENVSEAPVPPRNNHGVKLPEGNV